MYQPDRFELKSPVYSENFRQNEEATISIPYVNKGRGQVFNVEAKLEGDIPALEKDLTLGNFESGKSGTIDFVVTPKKTGKVEGKIRVSYEDEAMQQKTEEIPISVEVMEAQNEQADVSEMCIRDSYHAALNLCDGDGRNEPAPLGRPYHAFRLRTGSGG